MGNDIVAVMFERGLEASEAPHGLRFRDGMSISAICDAVRDEYGLRPLAIRFSKTIGLLPQEHTQLLRQTGKIASSIIQDFLCEIMNDTNFGSIYRKWFSLEHSLRGAEYHITNLAENYSHTCSRMWEISSTPGYPDNEYTNLGFQYAGYFEFDAAVTRLRRSWDQFGAVLWRYYGANASNSPMSFNDAVASAKQMPSAMKKRFLDAWEAHGKQLKSYRDCMHHNSEVQTDGWIARMARRTDRKWLCSLWIPDNPEVKSQRKYTYQQRRDALTYVWDHFNLLLDLIKEAFDDIKHQAERSQRS